MTGDLHRVRQRAQSRRAAAFTLIELMVVLAIVALMLTIALPRYIDHVDRARETTLKSTLKTMREAIDKFEGDTGRLPATLDELVERRYLRGMPVDPITERRDGWVALSLADVNFGAAAPPAGSGPVPGVADVRSGAEGSGRDGSAYAQW